MLKWEKYFNIQNSLFDIRYYFLFYKSNNIHKFSLNTFTEALSKTPNF